MKSRGSIGKFEEKYVTFIRRVGENELNKEIF